MIQFLFILGLICLASAALSGFVRPLKLNRWSRIVLGAVGLVLLGLGALLFATQEEPPPSSAHITFDSFPNGTPVSGELILRGNEFSAVGVRFAGAPESKYCAGATSTAIRGAGRYSGISFHFLTVAMPGEIDQCNGVPIEITFTKPVRQVILIFAGASVLYTLKAYDADGNLLGSNETKAVFQGGTFEAAFRSELANISRIIFGRTLAITVIKEISYER